jgi:hypothetical protein
LRGRILGDLGRAKELVHDEHSRPDKSPLRKAAESGRAIELVSDPERRIGLESLRTNWIALCNELSRLGQEEKGRFEAGRFPINRETRVVAPSQRPCSWKSLLWLGTVAWCMRMRPGTLAEA